MNTTTVASVILTDGRRTRVFLKRNVQGHQQWMLPSIFLTGETFPCSLSTLLSQEGIRLPQQQIEQQGAPVAWLYPTKEMQKADPSLRSQLTIVSLLTVVPQPLLASLPTSTKSEARFWPVYALPENILTLDALMIPLVLFAESRQALPIDMRKTSVEEAEKKREREWKKYLEGFLLRVTYSLAATTIVSVSFSNDSDGEKIRQMQDIMYRYGAYGTGPIFMHAPGRPNLLSFGFREQKRLDIARFDLGLPIELQVGSPIYIGPQPERGN